MDSLNKLYDSNPNARMAILVVSALVAVCGCALLALSGYSIISAGSGAASPDTSGPTATPTLSSGVLPTVPASTLPGPTPTVPIGPTLDPNIALTLTPGGASTTTTPGAPLPGGAPCDCGAERIRCKDFPTVPEAQACLDFCTAQGLPDSVKRLDQNENGVACDTDAETP